MPLITCMASQDLLGWLGRGSWYPEVLQKINNLAHAVSPHLQATSCSLLQHAEIGTEVVCLDLNSQTPETILHCGSYIVFLPAWAPAVLLLHKRFTRKAGENVPVLLRSTGTLCAHSTVFCSEAQMLTVLCAFEVSQLKPPGTVLSAQECLTSPFDSKYFGKML